MIARSSFFFFFILITAATFFTGATYVLLTNSVTPKQDHYSVIPLLAPVPTVETSWSDRAVVTTVPLQQDTLRLTFVGDVLLARSVELLMDSYGVVYPFRHTDELFASSSAVFANFEAAIPATHERTRAYTTKFSVRKQLIPALAQSGITHVSLANNHSLDFGESAYRNTREVLLQNNITPFGHSENLSTSSVTFVTTGTTTVAILALHAVFEQPDPVMLKQLVSYMESQSTLQIVYMHAGTEYAPTHDLVQEKLAHYLVTLGIDAIIGHHPHVVEDVQLIQGVPVFYSLGNFIFDQYFSTDVQNGLLLTLDVSNDQLVFTLVPVTSIGTHAQPRAMQGEDRADFLATLARRSDPEIAESIKQGMLILQRPLAE